MPLRYSYKSIKYLWETKTLRLKMILKIISHDFHPKIFLCLCVHNENQSISIITNKNEIKWNANERTKKSIIQWGNFLLNEFIELIFFISIA